jgi:ABC-type antimicrobial peptide transport system permease subunit
MEDYRELGSRYLTKNKKRSLITVIGCFIVAAILFCFLNTMFCWVAKCRIDGRKEADYDIAILTEDKDIIEKITNEDFVSSAYLGKEYSKENDEDSIYSNALHINVKEKLLISHYSNYINKTYGVNTELNKSLAWTYCQDRNGMGYIIILSCLLIAFIWAIIGVGVLRNNISISAMERVKDYGNLRCIGATRKQIKAIVFRESVFLETIGILGGIVAGFLLSILICKIPRLSFPIGFHFLAVIMLCIAFYGDMYFAVGDGLKKVLSVSPSEAVRGNYRIKNRRIKHRRSGIWGLIFGVEGDYAYKNIKRNNGRFIKTVMAVAFGMVIVVVIGGWSGMLFDYNSELVDSYGYYQQYILFPTNNIKTYDEQKADVYSPKAVKTISDANGIEDTKFIYKSTLYTAENRWVYKNLNEKYKTETGEARFYYNIKKDIGEDEEKEDEEYEERKAYRETGKGLVDYEKREPYNEKEKNYEIDWTENENLRDSSLDIYGYDQEDYARYEDRLLEGTTDLSENGILIVNQTKLTALDDYEEYSLLKGKKLYQFLDVKVGDEITIVDPEELYNLVQEEKKKAANYDKAVREQYPDRVEEYDNIIDTSRKESWIINSAREKLVEEGKCRTFIVEGILDGDPNWEVENPIIIVPLDKFYDITGKTESDYSGVKFHISNIFSRDFQKQEFKEAIYEKLYDIYGAGMDEIELDSFNVEYYGCISHCMGDILRIFTIIKILIAIALVMFVIIVVSLLNTMNVSISGLQTRRNEFAQLRSIGMTKKSLLKAVMLEGGIVWIIATVLGINLGIGIEYVFHILVIHLVFGSGVYIFWPGIIIASLLSLVVLCGSNCAFFKQMKLNVAEELIQSGN